MKTLIVGSAPPASIKKFLQQDMQGIASPVLAVNERFAHEFGNLDIPLAPFKCKGLIGYGSFHFMKTVLTQRPDKIIVLTGHDFFHENIFTILHALRALPAVKYSIECNWRDYTFSMRRMVRASYPPISWPYTIGIAALISVLVAALGFLPGLVLLAALALLEMVLRLHHTFSQPVEMPFFAGAAPFPVEDIGPFRIAMHDKELALANPPSYSRECVFHMPATGERIVYQVTYDAEGCRITSDDPPKKDKPEISILGASHSFGRGVSDDETFPWILQANNPDFCIKNRSVAGSTSSYNLLLLRRILKQQEAPDMVVYFCVPQLDLIVSQNGRYLTPAPSSVIRNNRLITYTAQDFVTLPFSKTLQTAATVQGAINWLIKRSDNNVESLDITKKVLLEMKAECARHGVEFLVAAGFYSAHIYSFLEQNGFFWIPCTKLETGHMEDDLKKWSLYPLDNHPNGAAHVRMADSIHAALQDIRDGKSPSPILDEADYEEIQALQQARPPAGMDIYPLF